ncbi:COQ9 family protein [Parvularcula sp. LCG005]|uniref:COQ9 family protein n=1 Tax=Parvularcula sp. LCG005 TaxID=3078805 RepID=UPI00294308B7|nr:COQ9 family protein [Parvularcula sp. LCG005]WOI53874.1 COQ9 family protein [Parvularcula sp. LCG005]
MTLSNSPLPIPALNSSSSQDDGRDDDRRVLLEAILSEAAFDGWTRTAIDRAALSEGYTSREVARGDVKILFPKGVRDVLDFWASEEDRLMRERFVGLNARPEKIRDKIKWLVRQRIEQLENHREAARRAAATLALPHLAGLGAQLAWRSAGQMWEALGDRSTDANFYTKRATLSAVYLSTLTRWFADEGDGEMGDPRSATWHFLDQRIDNVMQFEKVKAQARKWGPSGEAVAGLLGRLRYAGAKPSDQGDMK